MGNSLGVDVSDSMIRVTCVVVEEKQQFRVHRSQPMHCCMNDHGSLADNDALIRDYLRKAPLWGVSGAFCYENQDGSVAKVFCFILYYEHLKEAITKAIECLKHRQQTVQLTGGQAQELEAFYHEHFSGCLSFVFNYQREIACIREAVQFLYHNVPDSCYRYNKTYITLNHHSLETHQYDAKSSSPDDKLYPYLLVNMKAGVSFHLVKSKTESERVGGSTIGASTFSGLMRLLCPSYTNSLDAFLIAQFGNNAKVDMLVSDIYGGDYAAAGLKGSMIASSFGKVLTTANSKLIPENLQKCSAEHIWLSRDSWGKHKGKRSASFGPSLKSKDRFYKFQRSNSFTVSSSDARYNTSQSTQFRNFLSEGFCCCCNSKRWIGFPNNPHQAFDSSSLRLETKHKSETFNEQFFDSSMLEFSQMEEDAEKKIRHADIARSLQIITTYNVSQLAYFNCVIRKCYRIILVGFYLEMPGYLSSIQHSIEFASNGSCTIFFLRMALNLGSLGACLLGDPRLIGVQNGVS